MKTTEAVRNLGKYKKFNYYCINNIKAYIWSNVGNRYRYYGMKFNKIVQSH